MFKFPAVPNKGKEGSGGGDPESREAVQETPPQNVCAEKPPPGAEERVDEGPLRASVFLPLQEDIGKGIDLGNVVPHVFEGKMMQVSGEDGGGTDEFDLVMLRAAAPGGTFATEKPQLAVWVPITMENPSAEKPDLSCHESTGEAFVISLGKEVLDGLAEFWGEFFIAIQGQHPGLGAELERDIFLIAMPQPILVLCLCPEFCCDRECGVLRTGINHHNLHGQVSGAIEAAAEVGLFVFGDNGYREGQGSHERPSVAHTAAMPSGISLLEKRPSCSQ